MMHYPKFGKIWTSLFSSVLLIPSLFFASETSLAGMSEDAARQQISQLSGGWVGIIKVVPYDLRPVRKFNIQLKLSNPRKAIPTSPDSAYTYDVVVNIAPEGKPFVRSNISSQTMSAYTSGWHPNYMPGLSDFEIVPYINTSGGNPEATFLGGCSAKLSLGTILQTDAKGVWKGNDVSCIEPGRGGSSDRGEITLQRGEFDEAAKPAGGVPVSKDDNSISPQQDTPAPQAPTNDPVGEIKNMAPGLLRSIFR